jgi:hypothetical protein
MRFPQQNVVLMRRTSLTVPLKSAQWQCAQCTAMIRCMKDSAPYRRSGNRAS